MKRNRRNNAKKERIIMVASSVFVLSALTMTGIYMKSSRAELEDDGYTIDFTELEDNVQDKYEEIAQIQMENDLNENGGLGDVISGLEDFPEDDLDYMPMEVGSGLVEIPGLTDMLLYDQTITEEEEFPFLDKPKSTPEPEPEPTSEPEPTPEPKKETTNANVVVARTLHFEESEGLVRPVSGEVLIPFSMDGSVYFSTLDQYKYNPALMIAAEQGASVVASAEGKVVNIFQDEEIGHAITMELGDGYQITYGQLEGINVTLDSYVEPGDEIASVAAPTKYFSVEGSNLYLKLTMNGTPLDPELLFR